MVAAEFGRFLGLPVRNRLNITDIIQAVVGVLTDTRCDLVLSTGTVGRSALSHIRW